MNFLGGCGPALADELGPDESAHFRTGQSAFDAVLPAGGLAVRAVHELLADPAVGPPLSLVLLIARAARAMSDGLAIWCDRTGEVYPPAMADRGLPLDRTFVLRPTRPDDEVWAVAECLRSRAVGIVVACPNRLTRVEARRLRLAVEQGGGVALLLRPLGSGSRHHAATTRWSARPVPGDAFVQRWIVRLLHGHGGRVDEDARRHRAVLDGLFERLQARLGDGAIHGIELVDSHLPERAYRAIRPDKIDSIQHRKGHTREPDDLDRSKPPAALPLSLMPRPVEVRVTVAPSHDGDGPPIAFRDQGRLHRLRHVRGPDRIAGLWWDGHDKTRDYYDAEDETGRRFWLFRVARTGRWFLHGLFL